MNRRFAVLAIAAAAMLGLSACSGSPSAETGSTADSGTAAEAPTSDQSVADACVIVQTKLQEASTALSEIDITATTSDPQTTIDAFSETVDGIGDAAESVSNEEVKTATTAVHEDFVTVRDLMQKVLIEQDTSVAGDLGTATADMQTSSNELNTLCTS